MKEKCICKNILTQKQFFLLMIVPLLLGLMIIFTSSADADWARKDDPLLLQSPQKQGWRLVEERDLVPSPKKVLGKSLKTAER
ncbi:MAG TPA: hypothetical protein VMW10_12020 [Alphaproteobacteria bacterium]|nr:hypothetical protein [Alphaproteobacteria bacterium]